MKKAVLALSLLLIFGSTAYSQGMGLKSITGKVGLVLPEDPWDSGFFIGGEANVGELFQNTTLHPLIGYASSGYSAGSFDFSLSNFQIGADLHYHIADVPGLYAGGGLSLNFLSWEFPSFLGGTVDNTETELGIALVGGYAFPISNMTGVIGARYNLVDVFDHLELTFGLEFDMSK